MPIWGWVCSGLTAVAVLLVIYSFIVTARERKRYERDAEEMVAWIVQANSALYTDGGIDRPAQVLVAFDGQSNQPDPAVAELAVRAAALKSATPETPAEEEVAKLVRDESYRPFTRFRLPDEFTGGREVYSVHIWVQRSLLPGKILRHPFVRCLLFPDQPETRALMAQYQPTDNEFVS